MPNTTSTSTGPLSAEQLLNNIQQLSHEQKPKSKEMRRDDFKNFIYFVRSLNLIHRLEDESNLIKQMMDVQKTYNLDTALDLITITGDLQQSLQLLKFVVSRLNKIAQQNNGYIKSNTFN